MTPFLRGMWWCSLVLGAWPTVAAGQDVEGFVELRGQFDIGVDGDPWQIVERVRPAFGVDLSDRLKLSATLEAGLAQGRNLQKEVQRTFEDDPVLGPALQAAGCEWPAPTNDVLRINGADDYLSVERLYLDWYAKGFDVRLGRQAIQWGSAQIVNPTDPFPQVLQTQPWVPRAGVNALRTTIPIGELNQVQLVVGANDAFTAVRAAGRGTVTLANTDFSLIGAFRDDANDGLAGLDIKGTLGVGFWVEGALHIRDDPYEEVAVGIDYSFPVLDALLVGVQYYRNGAGSPDGAPAAGALTQIVEPPTCTQPIPIGDTSAPADPFAPFFHGRDYAMATVNLAVSPEVSITTAWIQNLGDGTALAVPMISGFVAGWLELSLVGQIPVAVWGDGGELKPSKSDLLIPLGPGGTPPTLDASGLVPDASVIAWARVSF